MKKRKIKVRRHKRRLRTGGTTIVRNHNRNIKRTNLRATNDIKREQNIEKIKEFKNILKEHYPQGTKEEIDAIITFFITNRNIIADISEVKTLPNYKGAFEVSLKDYKSFIFFKDIETAREYGFNNLMEDINDSGLSPIFGSDWWKYIDVKHFRLDFPKYSSWKEEVEVLKNEISDYIDEDALREFVKDNLADVIGISDDEYYCLGYYIFCLW